MVRLAQNAPLPRFGRPLLTQQVGQRDTAQSQTGLIEEGTSVKSESVSQHDLTSLAEPQTEK